MRTQPFEVKQVSRQEVLDIFYGGAAGVMTRPELEACVRFIDLSPHTWISHVGDDIIGAWGLIPGSLLSNEAFLWLHHTEKLEDHVFMFIRRSQIVMEEMLKLYGHISGHCEVNNRKAQRWLKWLGAEFEPYPIGDLLRFHIVRKQHGPN